MGALQAPLPNGCELILGLTNGTEDVSKKNFLLHNNNLCNIGSDEM